MLNRKLHAKQIFASSQTAYLARHKASIRNALERFNLHRWTTFFVCIVVAMALVIPSSFILLSKNLLQLDALFASASEISIYLKKEISNAEVNNLMQEIRQAPGVGEVQYISAEEGLKTFADSIAQPSLLSILKDNPLPAVLLLKPNNNRPETINALTGLLHSYTGIAEIQVDKDWLVKLSALTRFWKALTLTFTVLFSLAVILTIAHTIQFALERYRQEIEIFQLMGASKSMIQRPFLYAGFFYGLFGGLVATLIVSIFMLFLMPAIAHLAAVFNLSFTLHFFSFKTAFEIIIFSAFLGLFGAFMTVYKY